MSARSEYFRSYHLPVLSAEQNDSQPEEINVIDESQAEDRPVPVQEAEIMYQSNRSFDIAPGQPTGHLDFWGRKAVKMPPPPGKLPYHLTPAPLISASCTGMGLFFA